MGEELRLRMFKNGVPLRMFKNGVPRKISRYGRDAVTGGWRELQV
jgi:hypothetical protein